jgi:hypothetical protein
MYCDKSQTLTHFSAHISMQNSHQHSMFHDEAFWGKNLRHQRLKQQICQCLIHVVATVRHVQLFYLYGVK